MVPTKALELVPAGNDRCQGACYNAVEGGVTVTIPEQVVERLTAALPIEKVILFGSRARGTAHPDSDWDFLVVMRTSLPRPKRSLLVRGAARIKGIAMDFLVRTPDEIRDGFPLSKEILREGQVLYDAQH